IATQDTEIIGNDGYARLPRRWRWWWRRRHGGGDNYQGQAPSGGGGAPSGQSGGGGGGGARRPEPVSNPDTLDDFDDDIPF
ncbi:MAG: hypothetical protein U5R48_09435, partial [Gammaproteobacteria bacterium]|nr:hypothetical protein [Gammaproteobacteria bacterium]